MRYEKSPLWVMHSGHAENAGPGFVDKGYISLGWPKLGNLAKLRDARDAFKTKYRKCYPKHDSGTVNSRAGELYCFVHKMKPGDLVVYPSMKKELLRLGRVKGDYEYRRRPNREHTHVRKIEWLDELARDILPFRVKRTISGRHALYQPHKHIKELCTILMGRAPS